MNRKNLPRNLSIAVVLLLVVAGFFFFGSSTPRGYTEVNTSTALSQLANGKVKDAIFSNIAVGKGNVVSFVLSASLDPKLIAFNPAARVTPAPPVTSTTTSP